MQTPSTERPAAFTLIEIVLAMAIMAVICGTIYQFTGTTVQVANVATRVDTREQSLGGLRRLLAAQFATLPAGESQALVGAAGEGKDGRRDTIQMLCSAGNDMLTPDAHGPYAVTLEVRNVSGDKRHASLVLNREPWTTETERAAGGAPGAFQLPAVSAGGVRTSGAGASGSRPAGWVRLLDDVRSLELSYFDPRLNTWIDKWNDPTMTPALVKVRLALEDGGAPYEFVEKVPGGGVPRLPANLISANIPNLPPGLQPPGGIPGGVPGNKGGTIAGRPTAPPPGSPPSLPPGLTPPTSVPQPFDPGKPLMAPDTGTGLPPGFTR